MSWTQSGIFFFLFSFFFFRKSTKVNCDTKRTTTLVYMFIFQLTDRLSKSDRTPSLAVSGITVLHTSVI